MSARVKMLVLLLAVALVVGALTGLARERAQRAIGSAAAARYMPTFGGLDEGLSELESYWNDRLTYPTGRFNPGWLRRAAAQDAKVARALPAGQPGANVPAPNGTTSSLATTGFTPLGPQPLNMDGCSGCYNYTTTQGRVNAVAIAPSTNANGSIVAYAGTVGGGVWKTSNCCTASTSWKVVTDSPLIAATSIDTLAIDPHNAKTIYAGTGDLNYGSFSMGSQGILKSSDAGATWKVLGASVFGPSYSQPAGQFPQYDAVGKVRVDPNSSSRIVAGTKKGLFFSYDGGTNWTGPCLTNTFTSQRQDITGLELVKQPGGGTRIVAAVGTRGFATPVQYDLGANGANGIYAGTMPASGCPSFSSIASNANGFVFGSSVSGSPYSSGAAMNAASGTPYASTSSGNQLGRVDLAVAPSNANVIYAQVGSISSNSASGCGSTSGCQLGAWVTTNGGTSWTFMSGSAGGSLRNCSGGSGDYSQNWYDQGIAVDPNDADRVFFDTFDVWFATRTGSSWNDLSCGYSYSGTAGPVHTDQHALTFVPGSSSILALGNDGGLNATANAGDASATARPSWAHMDSGLNTIEFYSGDISGNFASSTAPQANGGAQDNGSSSVTFSGSPTGAAAWQMGKGGDGFVSRIDPVGGAFYQSNNGGHIHRCTSNCTTPSAGWLDISSSTMLADTHSFVLPYEIFKGTPGNPDASIDTDCSAVACDHMLAGTTRVWETINAHTVAAWYANSPNLTKGTLGSRSFINQLAYSPSSSSLAIAGTNDGNVQIGRGLGGGAATSSWTDVTGGNTVLPNRPILDVAFDPRSLNTAARPLIGYAAVGGFDANTPAAPGHVFRVVCAVDCASFSWQNKTGNLPDIPVDSIIANPNDPQQVFAGTDFGLYFTDDITTTSPTWYRFSAGLPSAMIWDMQIDRGATTLSVWTRGRGAYVWPLTTGPIAVPPSLTSLTPASAITGATITIGGTHLAGATTVKFGGLPSPSFTVTSSTAILARVPDGAKSGKVSVTTVYGTGTSTSSFTPTLSLQSISPAAGGAGTTVTLGGVGFTAGSTVKFNGTAAASVTFVSSTQLQALVPAGVSTGKLTVTNSAAPAGTVSSAAIFYAPATISSLAPASGITGSTVTINGANLQKTSAVTFNGLPAASVSINAAGTAATVQVPSGASSGAVAVTNPAGTTTGPTYTVTLSVQSFSPASGPAGTQVLINGVGFDHGSDPLPVVSLNGTTLTNVSVNASGTQITATVPVGATSGRIGVKNTVAPLGTVKSATNFTKT